MDMGLWAVMLQSRSDETVPRVRGSINTVQYLYLVRHWHEGKEESSESVASDLVPTSVPIVSLRDLKEVLSGPLVIVLCPT